jgi:hypothetical protein
MKRITAILLFSVVALLGCSDTAQRQAAEEQARRDRAAARLERGSVRVIAHHANPMVLYITTLPDPRGSWGDDDPKIAKLAIVDMATGQWRDLDLTAELKARFGLERPRLAFEVGRSPNEVIITRE